VAGTTVSEILTRIGLGRLGRLGLEPAVGYERRRPGELLHIDVKKLGRIEVPGHRITGNRRQRAGRRYDGHRRRGTAGWECVHVCVDDATRLAYAEVLADERAPTVVELLSRPLAFYRCNGHAVRGHQPAMTQQPPTQALRPRPQAPDTPTHLT